MKKKIYIPLLFIAAILILYSTLDTNTYIGRFFKWRASDIEDFKKFPSYDFKASTEPFYYVEKIHENLSNLEVNRSKKKRSELFELLEDSGTTAFIIIKNDTLIYEKYLNGYQRNSINTSFSVAKSITSLITGITIDEHLIKSVNDPVIDYIPNLIKIDTTYKELRISDLMDMQSGIQFKDHDLPWGDKPKAYYKPKLRERILELPLEHKPGLKFKYNSYNPILMGMIIEKVTNLPPATYFEKKIWNNLGMEYSGSWSMDSQNSGMTKMESGLNIRAIDFAKFGRLLLYEGHWNGNQLISKDWMNYSFAISKDYKLPEFAHDLYYRNFWWIYANKKESEYEITSIAGTGHLGQYLFVFPKENIVIVRMGKHDKNVDSWRTVFYEIVNHLNNNRTY
ncbi:MAG: beta-lactamase family protein [Bacteroidia bacterium]|nr:beta-lactamase family protein [Bacteroidia bacterium]MBT8278745.1 beta-lactamase family protein [Bacteroidia bacterium]MBT8395130.1 beta-lactamase family protein [Bacteroidia bacterium]NND26706.1 serine hydrolase [Flavobacteriaceae bacterium]